MSRPLHVSLFFGIALLFFGAGVWYASSRATPKASAAARRVLYYHDPMHPAYKSDRPGIAPDCGMELEPVYADAPGKAESGTPGAVRISTERQQLIGIRTATVERSGGENSLRTVGRVAVDETQVYRLTSSVDGWILKTYPKATGSLVKRGEPLLTFYGRDFLGTEQAYFYSLDSLDRMKQAGPVPEQQMKTSLAQIQQNKDSLLAMGMGERQVEEIAASRKLTQEILLTAPVDGFILARNVSPGLRFDRGIEFYRVADLSRVWIVADLQESDAGTLHPGSVAKVIWKGSVLQARMTDSAPQFDAPSRTLRIRLESANPGAALRPDMFVDVELPLHLPHALTVPADAVVDSGRRSVVYVASGESMFEPRAVEVGWRYGERVAITRGLAAGERVVTGGNFLLDSESRLRLAARPTPVDAETDPVCGMAVNSHAHSTTMGGRTYQFCSAKCKRDFDANPETYTKRGAR
jgi:membrane fusion protein, copper/silver efflux system